MKKSALKIALPLAYFVALAILIARAYPDAEQEAAFASIDQPRGQITGPFPRVPPSDEPPPPTTFNFRSGPERQGWVPHGPGVALHPAWTFPALNVGVHGASKASPAVDDSGVYVGGDGGWFYAFELDGRMRWRFHLSRAAKGIHATASLDATSVYIGGYDGRLYRIDKATGEVLWTLHLGIALGSSTVLHEGILYVGVETAHPDGYAIAVRARSGEVLWTSNWLGGHPHSSPALWPEKGLLFIGANSARITALDMKTGREIWHSLTEGPVKGTPTVHEGRVAFSSWGRKVFSLDALTGELVWETYLGDASQSSLTFVPGTNEFIVATSNGRLYWLRADSGKIVRELRRDGLRGVFSATVSPGAKPDSWIAWTPCPQGDLCALDARTAKPLATWSLGAPLTGAPTVTRDHVYVAFNAPTGLVVLSAKGSPP